MKIKILGKPEEDKKPKIEIPDNFLGEPIEGAYEAFEKGRGEKSKGLVAKSEGVIGRLILNIKNPEDYIILPGRTHQGQNGSYSYPDILVSVKRIPVKNNWYEIQEMLHKEGKQMLNIRQFVDFLNLVKSGNLYNAKGDRIDFELAQKLDKDLFKRNSPKTGELLDAFFIKEDEIQYDHRTSGKRLEATVSERIENPMTRQFAYSPMNSVSFDGWLKKANYQGLPTDLCGRGSLGYMRPEEGRVAFYSVDSNGFDLTCDLDPRGIRKNLSHAKTKFSVRPAILAEAIK